MDDFWYDPVPSFTSLPTSYDICQLCNVFGHTAIECLHPFEPSNTAHTNSSFSLSDWLYPEHNETKEVIDSSSSYDTDEQVIDTDVSSSSPIFSTSNWYIDHLFDQLHCLQKLPSQSLKSYFLEARSLASALSMADAPISEIDLMNFIIDGLDPLYNKFVKYYYFRKPQISLDFLFDFLIDEEKQCMKPSFSISRKATPLFSAPGSENGSEESESANSASANKTGLRMYQQAVAGISHISFGEEENVSPKKALSDAKQRELSGTLESEAEARLKKQISGAKIKELSGHDIFAPPPKIQPRPLAARALALRESISIGESPGNSNNAEEPVIKTAKKIPNQKFAELLGNNIFKGDDPLTSAEKPLSSAKLREMSGSNIFADGKVESRDYLGGVRKPPGGSCFVPCARGLPSPSKALVQPDSQENQTSNLHELHGTCLTPNLISSVPGAHQPNTLVQADITSAITHVVLPQPRPVYNNIVTSYLSFSSSKINVEQSDEDDSYILYPPKKWQYIPSRNHLYLMLLFNINELLSTFPLGMIFVSSLSWQLSGQYSSSSCIFVPTICLREGIGQNMLGLLIC